jgi:hypothetical protein
MNKNQLALIKDGDYVKLNKVGIKKLSGRFNHVQKYKVIGSRSSVIIIDDSGVFRSLNNCSDCFDICKS